MLSVVVNFFNNRREAWNTLFSLTRDYQRDAKEIPFEVIAVDNGSSSPLSEAQVKIFGPQFSYRFFPTTSPSPVQAINAACRDARGDQLLVIVDGAVILTPGVYALAHTAFRVFPSPFLAMSSFHIGPGKPQNQLILEGYNQQSEDELLDNSGWRSNGYNLYSVFGSFAERSFGWFGCLFESVCFGLSKSAYLAMGGLDERFQSRGGGIANMDFFQRALSRPELEYVMLLGEGTFHQLHGGVCTNVPFKEHPWREFSQEYVGIRGKKFERSQRRPFFMGTMPPEAKPIVKNSVTLGWDH